MTEIIVWIADFIAFVVLLILGCFLTAMSVALLSMPTNTSRSGRAIYIAFNILTLIAGLALVYGLVVHISWEGFHG